MPLRICIFIPIGIFLSPELLTMGKAEKTRQYIIEQTAPVFSRQGYAGTSINDLTGVTGLTKGSIYGNFKNKDEVALAAFDYNMGLVVQEIESMMIPRAAYIDKLLVFTDFYRDSLRRKRFQWGCPIVNTAPEVDDTHPVLRERVNEAIARWRKTMVRLMEKGMDAGEIKADTQPEVMADVIMALIEGAVMLAKSTGRFDMLRHGIDQAEKLIKGLAADTNAKE